MATRQAIEHAGEIGLGVETVELCSLDERVEDCRAVTAAVGTEEQKVLARDSDAAQQSLGQIVVDAEPAVVDIAGQGIPAAQPILQCLAQRRLAGQPSSLRRSPRHGMHRATACCASAAAVRRWSADRPLMSASIA